MADGSSLDITTPQRPLSGQPPMIIDSFAGGGGASTGIELALRRSPDVAINHDAAALSMHQANHPGTLHLNSNVWQVDPAEVCRGRRVGLAWFSPDCKHHSKAKGGKPVKKNIRDLAWVVVLWAKRVRPEVIILENVEEFRDWGPLTADNRPCPDRRGQTFDAWVAELKRLGYRIEHRELRACDYGAPTIRKRLFLIARCDGKPIVWPKPTHGRPDSPEVKAGQRLAWRTAADIIDWSLPCPSIFDTAEEIMAKHGLRAVRPLQDATLRRIARGVMRYVVNSAKPFLPRSLDIEAPLGTVVAGGGKHALVAAFLAQHNAGPKMEKHAGRPADEPLSTLTTSGTQQQVVAATVVSYYGEGDGGFDRSQSIGAPLSTVTTANRHAVVAAFLDKYYGADQNQPADEPLHTLTTKPRFGLVTVQIDGQTYAIADIGMRMLTPREQFRAQGFPESYHIETGADGRPMTKTEQTRMCGNSVSPVVARALVAANAAHLAVSETADA